MRPPPRATRTRSGACSRAAAPAAAEAEIDDSCVICGNDESEPFDLIVFCDGCNVTVCQSCYSIADVPEGDWFCRPCEAGVRDSKRRLDVTCKLCERQGGALEPTMCGGWVHTACCQCFEEVFLVDLGDGRSAASLTKLYRERRRGFACSLCPRKGGWCITCPRGTCKTAFHPACARERAERDGLVTYVQELPNGQPIVRICCAEHSRKLGGKPPAGVRMPKSCRALPGGMDAPDSNPTVRCDADAPPGGPERGASHARHISSNSAPFAMVGPCPSLRLAAWLC